MFGISNVLLTLHTAFMPGSHPLRLPTAAAPCGCALLRLCIPHLLLWSFSDNEVWDTTGAHLALRHVLPGNASKLLSTIIRMLMFLPNSYVEILTTKAMILESGALGGD